MITIVGKPGAGEKLEALFATVIPPTRAEPGCAGYRLDRDLEQPRRYVLSEHWRGLSALQARFEAPQMATTLADLEQLTAEPFEMRVLTPVAASRRRGVSLAVAGASVPRPGRTTRSSRTPDPS